MRLAHCFLIASLVLPPLQAGAQSKWFGRVGRIFKKPQPAATSKALSSKTQAKVFTEQLFGLNTHEVRSLVKKVGAQILEIAFLIELGFLNGREKLAGLPVRSLVSY